MPLDPRLPWLCATLHAAGCREPAGEACLAGAHSEPETITRGDMQPLRWYCDEPPPPALMTENYRTDLVWVEGPCDPCDRDHIAARAAAQTCDQGEHLPLRLLCGPVPFEFDPWDRQGCVYAVASDNGCQY